MTIKSINKFNEMSSSEICSAISYHMRTTGKLFGNSQYYHVVERPEITIFSHELNNSSYQGVLHSNLNPSQVNEKIEQVIDYYTSRGLTPIWRISPDCKPDNLGEYLEASGFNHVRGGKAMACDLDSINYIREKPDGLSVKYVEDNSTLKTFFDILTEGHPFPKPLGEMMYKILSEIEYGPKKDAVLYLGYYDDNPVATSFLHLDGSSAGLWWVATLENMRRRGIGTWMTVNSLREAHDEGYNLGVLYATEMGYPIYKKLGFKDYYTLETYIYNPTNE